MKSRSAKSKGMKFQRDVKEVLCSELSIDPDDIVPTTAGVVGVDLRLSPAAQKRFPFSIECKHNKAFSIYKIYDQAKNNMMPGTAPMAVIRQNRSEPLAVLALKDLIDLLK